MQMHIRHTNRVIVCALGDKGPARPTAVRSVVVGSVQTRTRSRELLRTFSEVWLPRLLQQQEDLHDTYSKVAQLGEKLATEVGSYKAKLAGMVQDMLVPTQPPSKLPPSKRVMSRQTVQPPRLDLSVLEKADMITSISTSSNDNGLGGLSPEAELAALVGSIQDTNKRVMQVDTMYKSTNTHIVELQEGAAERDKVQDEVCDMLLQYADELEREEQQQAAAMAAWEAEQARMAAEQAAYEAEQLRIAQEEAAARRWAEEAEREAARLAELNKPKPTAIKVDVGVQMQTAPGQDVVLVGSHPSLGSWDLANALPLAWSDGHVWRAQLVLPHDTAALEYKAVLVRSDGKAVWEPGPNHQAELQGSKDVSLFHVFKA